MIIQVNEDISISGPFRLDVVSYRDADQLWRFDLKVAIQRPGWRSSGYVVMVSSRFDPGLLLERCETEDGRRIPIDQTFFLPEQASRQMAGFLFSKRLVELGFAPMYNKQNVLVAPTEIRLENFSQNGIFDSLPSTHIR